MLPFEDKTCMTWGELKEKLDQLSESELKEKASIVSFETQGFMCFNMKVVALYTDLTHFVTSDSFINTDSERIDQNKSKELMKKNFGSHLLVGDAMKNLDDVLSPAEIDK